MNIFKGILFSVAGYTENELILPNFTQAGAAFAADGTKSKYFGRSSFTRWVVPVDDHHCVALAWANFGDRGDPIEYNNFLKDFGDILKEGLCGESTSEEKEKILVSIILINNGNEHLLKLRSKVWFFRSMFRRRQ